MKYHHKTIEDYVYHSKMKHWNASYKAIFALLALGIVMIANSMEIAIMTMVFMGVLTIGIGKIKFRDYLHLLLIPLSFILMSCVAIMIQFSSESVTYIYVTRVSIMQGVRVGTKALGGISCLYMLTLSTSMDEIIYILKKIKVPNLILELMHLIYRYIFILMETYSNQKDAARSRLGYCDSKTSFRTFSQLMANLLVVSFQKAGNYYDALEARGFEGDCLFWREGKKVTVEQVLWSIAYLGIAVVILYTCHSRKMGI